jgi:parvulin-like peptidyl-prolyl isomerase
MRWHHLVGSGLVVASLAGCGTTHPGLAAADGQQTSVSRLQKPEPEAPRGTKAVSLLDVSYKDLNGPVEQGQVAARIRATVNGVAILDDEIREAIYPMLLETQLLPEPERSLKQKEIFDREMQQLIEREIILQDAFALLSRKQQFLDKLRLAAAKEYEKQIKAMKKRNNIKTDEELRAALRSQGLTPEGVRRRIERSFMAMEYMRSRIYTAMDRITYEQILEYYNQHPNEFQVSDSVKWQDIFIDAGSFPDREQARHFAEDLAAKARAGEDFQKLALKYDKGDSSYRNGDGYGTRRGEIKPPEVEPVLFSLKDGQIAPVVPLGNGFHVLRLVKREYAGLAPFDEKTQAAIRNKLTAQVWEREYKRIIADLRRKASVEISTVTP